jgi:hypothetical protein
MKTLAFKNFFVFAAVVTFALVAGGWPHNANAQTPPAPESTEIPAPPVTPVAPPPNIVPGSPYAEVVRLTQAGVDQNVIATYVANSTSLFNLDSDKIIYLSDLGAPNTLVTAMMQRDQQLQQQFAATQAAQQAQQTQPPAPVQAAPPPETIPANTADVAPEPEPPVTVNYFYNTLSPYGSWVVINGYGRCWRPTVCVYDSTWQPYCDHGRWVYTDCGWYWSSSYAWGATFHYGRWFRDASVGWCWYPDTVWAPSWVTWRYSNNYCGWAPLPPRTTCQAGVGIVFNGSAVSVGFSFGLGANCFTFVPTQRFCDPHPRNFCVAPAQVTQVFNNTTVINNFNVNNRTIVNHGIAVQNISAATRTAIRPVPVHQMNNMAAHGWHSQSFNRNGYVGGANHMAFTGNSSSQSSVPAQNHFSQPNQNWNTSQTVPSRSAVVPNQTQPGRNTVVAMTPQRPVPAVNYYPRPQATPVQTPPADLNNSNPQPAPSHWQPTGTPRNTTRENESHQNYYSRPSAGVAPQPAAPAYASAPSQPQQSGNRGWNQNQSQQGGNRGNGNQNWPGH